MMNLQKMIFVFLLAGLTSCLTAGSNLLKNGDFSKESRVKEYMDSAAEALLEGKSMEELTEEYERLQKEAGEHLDAGADLTKRLYELEREYERNTRYA